MQELLEKLQMLGGEEVPRLTVSEAVKVSYPVVCNVI